MTSDEIRRLVHQLPPDCPYYALRAFRNDPDRVRNSTLADRLAVALSDVAFGWNVGAAYAEAGLDTPPFITESAIVRATGWLLYPDSWDVAVAEAQALNMPDSRTQRDLLRALLCCRDATLEQIADQCRIDPDVLGLFSELFWNVRLNEPLFVAQLLYRDTRFPARADQELEHADSGLRLYRLGYERGMSAVMRAAGPHLMDDGQGNTRSLLEGVERELLIQAGFGLVQGLVTSEENPALGLAMPLLLANRKTGPERQLDDDSRRGLAGMSLAMAINESFMRIMRPALERRLAVQRGIEAEKKAEQPAKTT
ncbi:MAG: hypothetical protein AB9869_23765 [Verrucomicrobiia bacterium]